MDLAGKSRNNFDGSSMPLQEKELSSAESSANKKEHINIEYWGRAIPEGAIGRYVDPGNEIISEDQNWGGYLFSIRNNTYKGLRLIGEDYNLYYSVWCTGDKEFYEMRSDPGQMDNYFDQEDKQIRAKRAEFTIAGRSFSKVIDRLDSLMMVLKSCKGDTCRDPWGTLHPAGNIQSLKDALSKRYDAFYDEQPKVKFDECALGYIREVEGPQTANSFDAWSGERSELKIRKPPSFVYQGNPHLMT
jgi:N-acetylglucosamine-6-sulfatase